MTILHSAPVIKRRSFKKFSECSGGIKRSNSKWNVQGGIKSTLELKAKNLSFLFILKSHYTNFIRPMAVPYKCFPKVSLDLPFLPTINKH